jgi:O-antigen/teichoic acid export membrane protein
MSNTNRILKNIVSMGVTEFSAKGLAVIYTIYLISTIGPESNGAFSFAKSIVQYFLIIVMLGFDQTGIRDVTKNHNLMPKYVGTILILRTILAIIGYLGVIIVTHIIDYNSPLPEVTKRMIYIYGFLLFAQATLLSWVYMAVEKMHIIAIRSLIIGIINLTGILLFVKSENDVESAMLIITFSFIINSLWMFIHYKKIFKHIDFSIDKTFMYSQLRQAFSIGAIFMIATLYNNIDITMLGLMRGEWETGIFSAAHQIIAFLLVPSAVIQNAFFPQIARSFTFTERDKVLNVNFQINFIIGCFLAFHLFFYSDLIALLLGDKFADSSGVLKILSMTIFLQYVVISYFQPLIAWKYENKVIKASLLGLSLNLVANLILIPRYGYYGAAFATIASEASVLTVLIILFKVEHNRLYLMNLLKALFATGIGIIPGLILMQYGINIVISVIVSVTACILIYNFTKIVNISEIMDYIRK